MYCRPSRKVRTDDHEDMSKAIANCLAGGENIPHRLPPLYHPVAIRPAKVPLFTTGLDAMIFITRTIILGNGRDSKRGLLPIIRLFMHSASIVKAVIMQTWVKRGLLKFLQTVQLNLKTGLYIVEDLIEVFVKKLTNGWDANRAYVLDCVKKAAKWGTDHYEDVTRAHERLKSIAEELADSVQPRGYKRAHWQTLAANIERAQEIFRPTYNGQDPPPLVSVHDAFKYAIVMLDKGREYDARNSLQFVQTTIRSAFDLLTTAIYAVNND
eukprot:GHVS01098529.1.p1 GENE.GHVS01098529.1~~GHVS01098529.1.p1  ORF type:complete len:268 (-),score=6.97 GHVS01098529.1:15-818(-)